MSNPTSKRFAELDLLPDLSQELASMGRGSMQRRIEQLEAELAMVAKFVKEDLEDALPYDEIPDRLVNWRRSRS